MMKKIKKALIKDEDVSKSVRATRNSAKTNTVHSPYFEKVGKDTKKKSIPKQKNIDEKNIESKTDETEANETLKSRKKKQPAKEEVVDVEDIGKKAKWEPENWELTLQNIREMRKNSDAPVDSMGCDMHMAESGDSPQLRRFHTLVSLMLSSQTKDEVNYAAMARLKNNGLTIDNVLGMDEETLGKLIYPVGFWRTKAKNVLRVCEILKKDYNYDIPNTIELMCSLPGVGPKMAHILMQSAWGVVSGIGVDTHVHRISNRLGWVKKPTKTPENTRVELEAWMPRELWSEVNHLLVGFGQQTCKPIGPLCEGCVNLSNCSFGQKEIREKKMKKKKK